MRTLLACFQQRQQPPTTLPNGNGWLANMHFPCSKATDLDTPSMRLLYSRNGTMKTPPVPIASRSGANGSTVGLATSGVGQLAAGIRFMSRLSEAASISLLFLGNTHLAARRGESQDRHLAERRESKGNFRLWLFVGNVAVLPYKTYKQIQC